MKKKHCWKCDTISEFEPSELPYVKAKTGGTKYLCIKCTEKRKQENNIKEVVRIETPTKIFSCNFIFITNNEEDERT